LQISLGLVALALVALLWLCLTKRRAHDKGAPAASAVSWPLGQATKRR